MSITDNKYYITLCYLIIPRMLIFIWQMFLVNSKSKCLA